MPLWLYGGFGISNASPGEWIKLSRGTESCARQPSLSINYRHYLWFIGQKFRLLMRTGTGT